MGIIEDYTALALGQPWRTKLSPCEGEDLACSGLQVEKRSIQATNSRDPSQGTADWTRRSPHRLARARTWTELALISARRLPLLVFKFLCGMTGRRQESSQGCSPPQSCQKRSRLIADCPHSSCRFSRSRPAPVSCKDDLPRIDLNQLTKGQVVLQSFGIFSWRPCRSKISGWRRENFGCEASGFEHRGPKPRQPIRSNPASADGKICRSRCPELDSWIPSCLASVSSPCCSTTTELRDRTASGTFTMQC